MPLEGSPPRELEVDDTLVRSPAARPKSARSSQNSATSPNKGTRRDRSSATRGFTSEIPVDEKGDEKGGEEADGASTGAFEGPAGTARGAAYSRPFKFLPPTPPQAQYSSSRACRAEDSSGRRYDRYSSMGDRYKGGNNFRQQRCGERPSERSAPQPTGSSGDSSAEWSGNRSCLRSGGTIGGDGSRRLAGTEMGGVPRAALRSGSGDEGGRHGANMAFRDMVVGGAEGGRLDASDEVDGEEQQQQQQQQHGKGSGRVAQIAEGFLWVQKHPVLAAAIWVFGKVLAPKEGVEGEEEVGNGELSSPYGEGTKRKQYPCSSHSDGDSSRESSRSGGFSYSAQSEPWEPPAWGESSGEFEEGRAVPSSYWRRHSKGRLSWSDDFGGSLAEYYEDERIRCSSDASSIVATECNPGHYSAGLDTGTRDGTATLEHRPSDIIQSTVSQPKERAEAGGKYSGAKGVVGVREDPMTDGRMDFGQQAEAVGAERGMEMGMGCGGLAHNDTFYGNMGDAIRSQTQAATRGSGGSDSAVACGRGSSLPTAAASSKQSDDEQDFLPTSTSAAEGVIASECDPLNGSGGSNGSGTGTWSPQWGWYVSMTPPQDMYPTPQTPSSAAKLPAPEAPEMSTSLKGRPPRP